MAAVGQLPIVELDEEDMANKRANLLKPDTDAKILKVKMAQELHQALSAGEDVLRNLRKFDIIVSMRAYCLYKMIGRIIYMEDGTRLKIKSDQESFTDLEWVLEEYKGSTESIETRGG